MTVWARYPGVLWRRIDGGVMVLAPDADGPAVLHGAAASTWELLDAAADRDTLAARATARHAAEGIDDLATVLDAALGVLADQSLIAPVPDAAGAP